MSVQPEYFGGTPTSPTGYREKKKSVLQGIIDDAKQSPIYKAGEIAARGLGETISLISDATSFQSGIAGFNAGERARATGADDKTVTKVQEEAKNLAQQKQLEANAGLGLGPVGVALGAAERSWSYGVARPASTAALITDPDSALYTGESFINSEGKRTELKPGFQWDDVRNAWNRSEEVSFGQAAVPNNLVSMTPGVGYLYTLGGINSYDPWSEYDMTQAQDNPYYRFVTGATDFGLEVAVPPVAKIGRLKALDRVGLRTTIKSADDIAIMRSDYDYHRTWLASEGKEGHKTTIGEWVDVIAEETNPVRLRQYAPVANANGVDKFTLSRILARTNDKDTVANILLANSGDFRAMRDLAEQAPDDVWALSDMNNVLRDGYVNGSDFMPEGDALIRTNQIFDSALSRDEYFTSLRNLFTTANEAEFKIRGPGSTWMPSKSMTIERIRIGKNKFTYAARSGDYTETPKWAQQVAESVPGGPVTVFLQWTGSRQPLGHVSKSGARPDDIWAELNASFDSVPMLRGNRPVVVGTETVGGEVVPVTLPASTYRNQMMTELGDAAASGNIMAAWRGMEDNLVDNMAASLGVDTNVARQFAAGYRQKADDSVAYMRESGGYVFDEKGSRVWVDPISQRQMLNSFPTLPLDDIYNALRDEVSLLAKYGGGTQQVATEAFDAGMRFFRTNVLFRPGYTGKNSVFEPLLSSWLAHGTILTDEGLTATLGNFVSNRKNFGKRAAYMLELDTVFKKIKGVNAKTTRQLRNELRELARQRNDVEGVIDDLLIELDNLKAGRLSIARAREVEPELRERLVDAQLRLEAIEGALDGKAPEWRQIVEPARLSVIREKLQQYKRVLESDQKITDRDSVVKMVDELQAQYDDLIARKDTDFSDPAREIEKLQKNLAIIDNKTAAAQVALGAKREAIGEVSGMRGFRGSGQGYMEVRVGGEKISVPAAFSDREFDFGSGYRAEASAATTNRFTYDPSYRAEHEMGRWQRTGQITEIRPNDPAYWDELTYVANRYFRDDPLIQRILRGDSRAQVGAWLRSNEGIKYQKRMGKSYLVPKEKYQKPVTAVPDIDPQTAQVPERSRLDRVLKAKPRTGRNVILESTTELDEVYRIVDQYFPDREVRDLIATREVTPGELQRRMGALPNLSRITGEDLLYIPGSRAAVAYRGMNRTLDRIWQFIATMPEDRVARWPFYQREFKYQMQRRADVLSGQGVKLDEKQFDAMRQASHRAALDELEKTFYNIRRYNTPVYLSRFLLSFPGAFFNSIYRYGRFAAKEPERLFQTALFANDVLTNMGVDAEGNPVENPEDAEYLIIPGTKRNMTDTGVRIPVASFASLTVNAPSLSYLATIATAEVTRRNPKTEEILKQNLGPAYDEIFPYGIPDNPLSGLFGSYQKDLWRAARGESDEDFITAAVQIYADDVALWEKNGGQGEEPSFEEAVEKTRDFFLARGGNKFVNAFTVNQRVPGQLMRDAWYKIRNQYPGNTQEARRIFLEQYGDWARWYTYSSSQYEAYLPSTQDAYDRVWVQHPDLTRDIVSVAQDDLSFVSLMAIGTSGDYSAAVGNYMRANPLPGDDRPVISRMPVEQFDNMIKTSDGWAVYNKNKALYDAEIARLREVRDNATTEESKDNARALIKANEESWKQWVTDYANTNEAWGFDFNSPVGNKPNNAALILNKMLSNKKFAKAEGDKPLWKNIRTFLNSREKALEAVRAESSSDNKREQKLSFVKWVTETLLVESPEFNETWQRFFAREWAVE